MIRPSLDELGHACHKPGHPRLGSWLARHVGRPAALRITWVILPCGVSAHAATLAAWALGLATATLLALGSPLAWLAAAATGWLWYLADHVDGQLARWHRSPSLDGAQLDYWMHHSLAWAWPLGFSLGLARARQDTAWLAAGLIWATAAQVVSLEHDTRWKAFEQRLKRLRGWLRACGGGGGRPEPPPQIPRSARGLIGYLARKSGESAFQLLVLSVLAVGSWAASDSRLYWAGYWVVAAAVASVVSAARVLWISLQQQRTEQAFAQWFQVPAGWELVYRDGWWYLDPTTTADPPQPANFAEPSPTVSS